MESPVYTAATLSPSTLPLSWGGKAEVRMARPVAKIIALPAPWRIRKTMSCKAEEAAAQSREDRVKATIPKPKILFLPYKSASRPKGTRHTAEARRYDVGIQVRITASILNSLAIAGRARLMDDPMKGVMKELRMAMIIAARRKLDEYIEAI
jgi:hypothetical protein